MKALTIKQPWAELIMLGVKTIENRHIGTDHRGKLAIHVATQRFPAETIQAINSSIVGQLSKIEFGQWQRALEAWERNARAGHVIGTVDLIDCTRGGPESPWAEDRMWHWVLDHPRRYKVPIRTRGNLGLWEWSRS